MLTAGDLVKNKSGNIISVSPDTTIHKALQVMVEHKIGAVLIIENEEIVGIWTERDLMRNALRDWFNPKVAQIKDYMTPRLHWADAGDSIYHLMDKFLGLRVRHLPIKENDAYIGLLSIGDVMKACLHDKTDELKKLNGLVSWQYYEEWQYAPETSVRQG